MLWGVLQNLESVLDLLSLECFPDLCLGVGGLLSVNSCLGPGIPKGEADVLIHSTKKQGPAQLVTLSTQHELFFLLRVNRCWASGSHRPTRKGGLMRSIQFLRQLSALLLC